MLDYDKLILPRIERLPDDPRPLSEVVDQAACLLDHFGWTTESLCESSGAMCMTGALYASAMKLDTPEKIMAGMTYGDDEGEEGDAEQERTAPYDMGTHILSLAGDPIGNIASFNDTQTEVAPIKAMLHKIAARLREKGL